MHRCYPQCKPEIGYHYSRSTNETEDRQLKKHVDELERELNKAKDLAGLAPNPDKYDVKDVLEYGKYKVLLVHYPNCTNYRGVKCIVAECSMVQLIKLKRLDPHFTEVLPKDGIKIIARFPPSAEGIEMAKDFAKCLQDNRLKRQDDSLKRSATSDDW